MHRTNLFGDDSAATPVIGVLLMVAIAVVLAAVIGTFVLGLNSNVEAAPTAQFSVDYQNDATEATITHEGGDDIPTDQLRLAGASDTADWGSGAVTSGDSVTVSDITGEKLRIIWSSESGETTHTLTTSTVPN